MLETPFLICIHRARSCSIPSPSSFPLFAYSGSSMYTHWESEGKCQNGTVWYIGRMCVRCEIEPEVYRVHWHGTYYIAWGPEWCISVALTSERGEQWLAIPREWQSNLKGVLSQAHICFFGRKKAKKSKSDRVNFSEDVCAFFITFSPTHWIQYATLAL